MTGSNVKQASTLNRCLFFCLELQPRGDTVAGRPLFLHVTSIYPNEKKNKTQNCSHLRKGGGGEDCQGESVSSQALWQTRKGTKSLSAVLRVP